MEHSISVANSPVEERADNQHRQGRPIICHQHKVSTPLPGGRGKLNVTLKPGEVVTEAGLEQE